MKALLCSDPGAFWPLTVAPHPNLDGTPHHSIRVLTVGPMSCPSWAFALSNCEGTGAETYFSIPQDSVGMDYSRMFDFQPLPHGLLRISQTGKTVPWAIVNASDFFALLAGRSTLDLSGIDPSEALSGSPLYEADIIARLDSLKEARTLWQEALPPEDVAALKKHFDCESRVDLLSEIKELQAMYENGGDFRHADECNAEWAESHAKDNYTCENWEAGPFAHIDWAEFASELTDELTSFDLRGETYYSE